MLSKYGMQLAAYDVADELPLSAVPVSRIASQNRLYRK